MMKNKPFLVLSALVCALLCLSLCLTSCSPSPPDYFAFRTKAASAELKGVLFGKEFSAKLTLTPQDSGYAVTLSYLSLGTHEELHISVLLDGEGHGKSEASVSLAGLSVSCEPEAVQGLLAPVTALFSRGEPSAVTRQEDSYILRFENGSVLTLGEDGLPRRVHTENVDFLVVWWENAENFGK